MEFDPDDNIRVFVRVRVHFNMIAAGRREIKASRTRPVSPRLPPAMIRLSSGPCEGLLSALVLQCQRWTYRPVPASKPPPRATWWQQYRKRENTRPSPPRRGLVCGFRCSETLTRRHRPPEPDPTLRSRSRASPTGSHPSDPPWIRQFPRGPRNGVNAKVSGKWGEGQTTTTDCASTVRSTTCRRSSGNYNSLSVSSKPHKQCVRNLGGRPDPLMEGGERQQNAICWLFSHMPLASRQLQTALLQDVEEAIDFIFGLVIQNKALRSA